MHLRRIVCSLLPRPPPQTLHHFMSPLVVHAVHPGSCVSFSTSSTGGSYAISEEDLSSKAKRTIAESNQDDELESKNVSEEDYMRPQPRKERIRKCLAKLKKGPDGRFINVLEVASDVNMLIAAYQNLKAQERPTYLIEDSDEDDSMEGINIERFKKLQRRLRSGTYKFGSTRKTNESESSEELEE